MKNSNSLDTARDILEKALEPLCTSVAGDWQDEFYHKFWYINNDTMHEKHAEGCKCRSGYRKSIIDFFSAREEKQKEAIKSLDIEKLIKLIREA